MSSRDNVIYALDLFCGGGGSGNGILEAFRLQGKVVHGTFINHWDHAINTHVVNHPEHRHLCTGVDDVLPRQLYRPDQHLNFLWGSPECTHHSQARGGKPVNEQSRATAQCLVRWLRHSRPDHMLVENVPEFFQWGPCIQKRDKETGRKLWVIEQPAEKGKKAKKIETVLDLPSVLRQRKFEHKRDWLLRLSVMGIEMALTADKKRAGTSFQKWKRKVQREGFMMEHRVLCSADYGDPTTRRRLFVNCVRIASGKKVVWPDPTHAKPKADGTVPAGLKPWVPARAILNLADRGTSIFGRKRPLKKKSLYRIAHGIVEYGLAEFILPQQRQGKMTKPLDEPISPVTTTGAEAVVTPHAQPLHEFIIPQHSGDERAQSIDRPAPTTTTTSRGIGLAQPEMQSLPEYIVQQQGQSTTQSVEQPLTAICASTTHHSVARPVLIKLRGTSTAVSVDMPVPTVTAGGNHEALATVELKSWKRALREQLFKAFCVAIDQHGGNSRCIRDIDQPISTLVTKNNQGVVTLTAQRLDPAIIETAHGQDHNDEGRRARSADAPLGTIHASGTNFAVAQTEVTQLDVIRPTPATDLLSANSGERREEHDNGLGNTQATVGPNHDAIDGILREAPGEPDGLRQQPFVIPNFGERATQDPRTHGIDEPLPTATSHGAGGLVSAELIPLDAFTADTAHTGADEQRVKDLLKPLDTICGNRCGIGVVRPFIARFYSQGGQLSSTDDPVPTATTKDRMAYCLPVLEIEGEYYVLDVFFRMLSVRELARAQGFPDSYEFPGTKTNAVKAIGNAVSCGIARALTLAATTQNPRIVDYLPIELAA